MEHFRIRQIELADNVALAHLIRAVFEEHNAPKQGTVYSDPTTDQLFETFQIPGAVLWVAEMDGELLGLCGIYPTPGLDSNCVELVKFYLLEQARGKGIGKALMQHCFQSAIEFGYKRLYIESMPSFAKAVRIYEQLGFERLKAPMGNSGHSSCNIWMIKELEHS